MEDLAVGFAQRSRRRRWARAAGAEVDPCEVDPQVHVKPLAPRRGVRSRPGARGWWRDHAAGAPVRPWVGRGGVVAVVLRDVDEPDPDVHRAPERRPSRAKVRGRDPASGTGFATTGESERYESSSVTSERLASTVVGPVASEVPSRSPPSRARGRVATPRRIPAGDRALRRRVTAMTAAASSTPPDGRYPGTWADATPAEVRAVLTPESVAEFDRQWREALSRAADTYDLTVVHVCLDAWRRVARVTVAAGGTTVTGHSAARRRQHSRTASPARPACRGVRCAGTSGSRWPTRSTSARSWRRCPGCRARGWWRSPRR